MKHYLNVCDISGAKIKPVDVITFGSPCQDMSVAGKREGLKHSELGDNDTTRSGLFYEAVRIIKEMRKATNGEYPKYAVWENVPGAFSSNKGRDFKAVLEALCSVCDSSVSIPEPDKNGKSDSLRWLGAGEIVGDNYSVCWRTLDAQYWGVPQRRKRIYLVADFTGKCARKVLFEQAGLRGDMQEGDEPRKEVAVDALGSSDGSNRFTKLAYTADCRNSALNKELSGTLQAKPNGGFSYNCINPVVYGAGSSDVETLCFNEAQITSPTNGNNPQWNEPCHTLSATDNRAPTVILKKPPRRYIIRRLTPIECARLQGFPDNWGELSPYNPKDAEFWELVRKVQAEINGKKYRPLKNIKKWYEKLHNDGSEYKMWGNGIALPCAEYVMSGISKLRVKTIGSLFDGSGGFPLSGAMNGITPVWSSEIEPYPIAVTMSRFK